MTGEWLVGWSTLLQFSFIPKASRDSRSLHPNRNLKWEFEIGLKIPEGDHVYQKQVSAFRIHTRLVTSTTKPFVNSHWSLFLDESGLRSRPSYGHVTFTALWVIVKNSSLHNINLTNPLSKPFTNGDEEMRWIDVEVEKAKLKTRGWCWRWQWVSPRKERGYPIRSIRL